MGDQKNYPYPRYDDPVFTGEPYDALGDVIWDPAHNLISSFRYNSEQIEWERKQKSESYKVMYPVRKGSSEMEPVNRKSKHLAVWLAIFLGFTGAHNFYLHKYKKALAQAAISLFSGGFLIIIPMFWGFSEVFKLLNALPGTPYFTDGRGVPLL